MSHIMDKKRFMELLEGDAPSSFGDTPRVNWEGIFADAAERSLPMSAREFYDEFVQGNCGFSYCKKKLSDLFDKKKVARIVDGNKYYYSFDPDDIARQHKK